jgi:4-hydroxybenzoate polyprenyltransferase
MVSPEPDGAIARTRTSTIGLMPTRVRALLFASHPGPCAVVTVVSVALGVSLGYSPLRLALLAAMVLCGQLSIGWSNDWIDSARDAAVHRADKPIARGAISRSAVRTAAFLAVAASILLGFPLGPIAAVGNVVCLAAGWSYNLGLKSTVFSVLPYVVFFGLLPAVATLGQPNPRFAAPWVLVAGALLGVAAHLTNVLPDLADDRRTGVRGLPHLLGSRVSGLIAFACLAVVGFLLAVSPAFPPPLLGIIGLIAALGIAIAGTVLVVLERNTRTLMRLVMAGALVDVALLALSGQALVA